MLLTNPELFNGYLLLRPSCIKVLGGVVPEMYELWKAQEVMGMKNRFRATIRNVESHPPKFISFEEFVKLKKRGIAPKTIQEEPKPTPSQSETKKIEDLDLKEIEGRRKEALGTMEAEEIKDMGKWGSSKQVVVRGESEVVGGSSSDV